MITITIISCLLIVTIIIKFIDMFSDYSYVLAQNCESIFGLNSFFFKDIMIVVSVFIIALFFLISIITSIINKYKPKDNQTQNNKPSWFAEKLIYTNQINKEKETTNSNWFSNLISCVYLVCILILMTDITMVKDELLNFDIQGANEVYQQKCIAKEAPFDKLDKK